MRINEILTCTHWHCAPSTCGSGQVGAHIERNERFASARRRGSGSGPATESAFNYARSRQRRRSLAV